MQIRFHDVRVLLAKWRAEDARVADAADLANIARIRWFAPVGAFFSLLTALVFAYAIFSNTASGTSAWRWGSLLLELVMGLGLIGVTWIAHRQPATGRTWSIRYLPECIAAVGMAYAVAHIYLEQWAYDSTTSYIYVCLLLAVTLLLRPGFTLGLYGLSLLAFGWVVNKNASSPYGWPSNCMDGLTAYIMGCSVSIYLWRRSASFYLQHMALEQAHKELQDKQRELQRLTRTDGLTGLFNRKTFAELTQQELQRAQRQSSATAILVMDLDYFKKVNDTYGHPAGDAVLKHAATMASSAVRSTDLVARLGGEEFIVLLPSTTVEAARRLAEKIRAKIETSPALWNGQQIPITVSIGSAGATAADKLDFDTLYHSADKALYLAKQRGRNRVV